MENLVLAFGEVLWDILPTGKVLGGAPANVAFRLQERGVPVQLVSRIGNDSLGLELENSLRKKGITCKLLQLHEKLPTGSVEVELNDEGNPRYRILDRVAYDEIELSEEIAASLIKAKVICYGSLVQRSLVSRNTLMRILDLSAETLKVCDINLRPRCYEARTILDSLKYADILKLNRAEVEPVASIVDARTSDLRDFAKRIVEKFELKVVLITLGEGGVFAYSSEGEEVNVPTKAIRIIDTIGSGDAFTAGFILGTLQDKSLWHCCQLGNALGALAATKQGGMSPISDDELSAWLV